MACALLTGAFEMGDPFVVLSPFLSPAHILSAIVSGWESEETDADDVHVKTPRLSQCDGEEQEAVAARDGTGLCRGIGDHGLDGDRRFYANACKEFSRGTLKIPSSTLDRQDSC
ncbi:MAG: hypothetical protein OEV08_05955 [Nitrospira sp.]|nr:hypothetical protein [Nitrospira sp.]